MPTIKKYKDFLKYARPVSLMRSAMIRISKIIFALPVDDEYWVGTMVRGGDRPHRVLIAYKEYPKSQATQVSWVACDCEDHVYRHEWALWRIGKAQLLWGNGKPPVETNPSYKPSVCKHVIAAMRDIPSKLKKDIVAPQIRSYKKDSFRILRWFYSRSKHPVKRRPRRR